MDTLQAAQFTRAVAELRQQLLEEMAERELELRAQRRLRQRDFAIWIVERKRETQDPVLSDVLWASGSIATAMQLALACALAREFVCQPRTTEYSEPSPRRAAPLGLTM